MGDGVAAPIAAVVAPTHGEEDKLLRILDGQEPQQDLVEKSKNRRIRADAESQGQNGHHCEAGSARERAEGVHQIASDGIKPVNDAHSAVALITGFGHRNPPGSYRFRRR
jgi:hypothetical protein